VCIFRIASVSQAKTSTEQREKLSKTSGRFEGRLRSQVGGKVSLPRRLEGRPEVERKNQLGNSKLGKNLVKATFSKKCQPWQRNLIADDWAVLSLA